MGKRRTYEELASELTTAQSLVEELQETLRAITNNEVDALVVDGPDGQQVFTLQGPDQPYRTLMETMSEGALTTNPDGTILYCNKHFSELVGMPLNKIIGISFHDFIVKGQSLEAMLKDCRAEGCKAEFSLKTADGREVPVSLSANLLTLNDAETFCIVTANLTEQKRIQAMLEKNRNLLEERVEERTAELQAEIAERKRLEEESRALLIAVQEEKDKLSALVNNIQDEVWFSDANKIFTLANPAARQEFRFGAIDSIAVEEMAANLEVYRPDGTPRPIDESPALRALKGEIIINHEEIIRTPATGELRYREVNSAPVKDIGSNIIGSVSIVRDITERKRMEEELRRSRDELELRVRERTQELKRQADLLELAHDAILVRDMEGTIIFWNYGAEIMYGWKKDEAMGAVTHDLLKTRFPVPLDDVMTVLMHTGKWEGQLEHITKDGRKIQVLGRHALQRDSAENPVGIMEIHLDVTAARQMEEQLRQSQKMEAIGTLAGGIAHDFNNILAAILGFTEMAMDDASDGRSVDKSLQNVHRSTLRARDLVKQILTFSRKTSYDRAPVSLSPLVKETVQLLRASIPATIEIKLSITATSDTVLAAPTEVHQILMNLATNASLAMEEKGGVLEISLTDIDFMPGSPIFETEVVSGEYVQLMVRDTGTGMGPDVMRRIFEPFFTTRELGTGTGMGLAVVYGIVTDLEGTITVESEPGVGSSFRVFLPKIKVKAKKARTQRTHIPTGTESVLFVDDEDMLVEWAKATLGRLGYRATVLTDPAEALKIFASEPSRFDLVITDQAMPAMSGMQLAGELLAIRPDIPIVLCTGHSATVSPEKAKKAGIKEFLMKPVTRQELANAVRKALDQYREK